MATRLMILCTASKVAFALAAVPPESVPRHVADTALDARGRRAERALGFILREEHAEFERHESNPQENTMRAPLSFAAASYASIICRIQTGSPQRSK